MYTYTTRGIIIVLLLAVSRSSQVCEVPAAPIHGRLVAYDGDCPRGGDSEACRGEPGASVTEDWTLFVECYPGYAPPLDLQGVPHVCTNGSWVPPPPQCTGDRSVCPLPAPPPHGHYEPLECGEYRSPGAAVPSGCALLYTCDSGYSLSAPLTVCINGTWDLHSTPTCYGDGPGPETSNTSVLTPEWGPTAGCPLPAEPAHRQFCRIDCEGCSGTCSMAAGAHVNPGQTVTVTCQQGYGLSSQQRDFEVIVCSGNRWKWKMPECLKLCPPLESDSLIVQCELGATTADCSRPMVPGTTASFRCRPSHSEYSQLALAGIYKRVLSCRQDGTWSNQLSECKADCGESKGSSSTIPLIVDGEDTNLGVFPWHVGIYTNTTNNTLSWKHLCGGTLITKSVVLTAAHCVHRKADQLQLSPSDVRVALAKYYRSWNHTEQHEVKRNVSRIAVGPGYNGPNDKYALDIALLVLSESVTVDGFVMPVCRYFSTSLNVTNNSIGYVVGWGRTTENGEYSETLRHANVSIIDGRSCRRIVPPGTFTGDDKICSIKESTEVTLLQTGGSGCSLNTSTEGCASWWEAIVSPINSLGSSKPLPTIPVSAFSVTQPGDSGGGLTTIGVGGLHYIVGIVSIKKDRVSLYTNIAWSPHQSWLEKELKLYT